MHLSNVKYDPKAALALLSLNIHYIIKEYIIHISLYSQQPPESLHTSTHQRPPHPPFTHLNFITHHHHHQLIATITTQFTRAILISTPRVHVVTSESTQNHHHHHHQQHSIPIILCIMHNVTGPRLCFVVVIRLYINWWPKCLSKLRYRSTR